MIENAVDRMLLSKQPEPLVVVGGGSILVRDAVAGASRVVRPDHFEVANAVGAAIGQISGEVDRVVSLERTTREQALKDAQTEATRRAEQNGALPGSAKIVDIEEIPVAYVTDNVIRVRARAVGDLPTSGRRAPAGAHV